MSVVTEKSKCRILKLASMLAVTMGIIMAFYAFYIHVLCWSQDYYIEHRCKKQEPPLCQVTVSRIKL